MSVLGLQEIQVMTVLEFTAGFARKYIALKKNIKLINF